MATEAAAGGRTIGRGRGCGGRGGRGGRGIRSLGSPPPPLAISLADVASMGTSSERAHMAESTVGGETTCVVCFFNPKTHLAAPCGHQCACGPCSEKMTSCPYCRADIMMWIQVRVA